MTWEFFATAFVVVAIPGTGVVYTLAVTIGHGLRNGTIAAFGCTLGIVPPMAASITGLAALLHTSPIAFQVVQYAGVAYLLWMAWGVWQGRGAMTISGRNDQAPVFRLIRDGILLNFLNPKLSIFFLAFLPQFVDLAAPSATLSMILLGSIFMAMTFLCFVVYASFAARVRDRVLESPTAMSWMRRGFAACFGLLALRLALSSA